MKRSNVLFILPVVLTLFLFFFFPLEEIIRYSFTNARLFEKRYSYTLINYKMIFTDPDFLHSLKITVIFVIFSVIGQVGFGLLLGLLFYRMENIGLRYFSLVTRTVIVSAWVLPGVAIGIMWKLMFSDFQFGIVNYFLSHFVFHKPTMISFLSNARNALIIVTVSNIWRGLAFSMLLQYAALKQVPKELYEVASLDGASKLQRFFFITLPCISQQLLINITIATISTFNVFDAILSLTRGGPGKSTEVLSLMVYRSVFSNTDLSYGSAVGVILLIINLLISLMYLRVVFRKEVRA